VSIKMKAIAMLLLATTLVSASALARQTEMVDLPYQALRAPTGTALTSAQVEAAIRDGARTQDWKVVSSEPGRIQLRLTVSSHAMDVLVKYDDRGFDMDYVSSENLNYQLKRGTSYIHPNYNVWTFNLADTIATSPALDPGYVAEEANAPRPPPILTKLKLAGPIYLYRDLSYRRGYFVDEDIRSHCAWNQGYAGMTQYLGKGLVKVTREDIATLPGYTLRATVVNLRATHGLAGPKWAVIHVELFDNGKVIGELEARRVTTLPLKGACESLNKVAGALAEDTVQWLQAGQFEARPDAPALTPMETPAASATSSPAAGAAP